VLDISASKVYNKYRKKEREVHRMDTYIIITETTIIEVADSYSEPNFFTENAESVDFEDAPEGFIIY
jgi:hypothetical protein